jgi:GNAT superfamily N-acetyltransferase
MITIRPATIEDLPILLQFEQGMIIAERPMDITLKREKTFYYDLPKMIDSERAELVVAIEDDELIGCGYARSVKAQACFQFDQFSYLGFMFTKEEYRGKGVNKKIMDHLYDWSLARGIYEVRLEVYPDNPAAIRAYEKAGMYTSLVTMRVDLRNK